MDKPPEGSPGPIPLQDNWIMSSSGRIEMSEAELSCHPVPCFPPSPAPGRADPSDLSVPSPGRGCSGTGRAAPAAGRAREEGS